MNDETNTPPPALPPPPPAAPPAPAPVAKPRVNPAIKAAKAPAAPPAAPAPAAETGTQAEFEIKNEWGFVPGQEVTYEQLMEAKARGFKIN